MYTIGKIETKPERDPYHSDTGGITSTVLKIYEDGEVIVTQDYNDNATPSDEWHSRTLTFSLEHVNEDELREYLTDNRLLERIVTGHSVEWNGNNLVGRLTEDAQDAANDLQDELKEFYLSVYYYWRAEDWLGQVTPAEYDVYHDTTDAELEKIAAEIANDADGWFDNGAYAILDYCDVLEYITGMRDLLREELDD